MMMMKMGFLCGPSSVPFKEHVRAREPPMASSCLLMAEQQVNAAHMEKAAARVLIIKEARCPSSCIVPSHDGHKRVDYPFQRRLH